MKAAWCDALIQLVLERTGLVIRVQDSPLLMKDIEVISQQQLKMSPQELLQTLQSSKTESNLAWRTLLNTLTIGESYFFRDQGQFNLLSDHIFPELLAQKKKQLRIWSAACSSGEEAYSIAILLKQLLPVHSPGQEWDISIVASDINHAVLDKARAGIYSAWSFRRVAPAIREMYFTKRGEEWKINSNIQSMVQFYYGNLQEDEFPNSTGPFFNFDLIICRNVFIYFSAETVYKIAGKFAACLNQPGYLMTGHGELGLHTHPDLQIKCLDNLLIYQKNQTKTHKIPPAPPPKTVAPIPAAVIKPRPAIPIAPPPVSFADLLHQGKLLANKGQYLQAEQACHAAIQINHESPHPYLLLAQIAEITGKRDECKAMLKKSLYLDHDFLAAYVELFNIYIQEDNKKNAEKMLESALQIVRKIPGNTPIALYDETSASELLAMLMQFKTRI